MLSIHSRDLSGNVEINLKKKKKEERKKERKKIGTKYKEQFI